MDIKEKIIAAISDMEKKVERDKKHVYRDKEKRVLQGVSSVSNIVPKDWLSAWGAKEAVKALGYTDYLECVEDLDRAGEIWLEIVNCGSVEEYIKILKKAKGAAAKKSKDALVDGKAGHAWIEEYVKAKIENKPTPEIPKEGFLQRPLTQFVEWAEKYVDYWIASEALICRLDKGYAGQMDAIAMMSNGKLAVVDFKFASHISEDYSLQTAGYQACFEPYDIHFDHRIIVRLPKTLEAEVYEDYKYKKVPNNIEVKVVSTPYELDRDTFYHALPLKKWINLVKKED